MNAPNQDRDLSQYYDRELPPDEATELRAQLEEEENAELREKLAGLEHLSTLIAVGAEDIGADIDGDSLFEGITAAIAQDLTDEDPMFPVEVPASTGPSLRVVDGGKQEEVVVDAPPEKVAKPREDDGRGVWFGVGALALAAAAALAFFYLRPAPTIEPPPEGDGPIAVADPEPMIGTEVEEIDFGHSTGAIFALHGEEGERYAVIWISDAKFDRSGRHPLTNERIIEPEGEERIQ